MGEFSWMDSRAIVEYRTNYSSKDYSVVGSIIGMQQYGWETRVPHRIVGAEGRSDTGSPTSSKPLPHRIVGVCMQGAIE